MKKSLFLVAIFSVAIFNFPTFVHADTTPNVTLTPTLPAAGQTVSISGSFSAGQTVSNARVILWLFNSANNDLLSVSATANFTGSQSTAVTASINLSSALPAGSYYLTSGIYTQNGTLLKWLGTVKTFTIEPASSGGGGPSGGESGGNVNNAPGVTLAPTSPAAGQVITLTANLSAGQTVSDANAAFWLLNSSGGDLGSHTTTATFTGSQLTHMALSFALPSTLTTGSYSFSSAIYDQNWKLVKSFGIVNTFSVGTSGGTGGGGGGSGGGNGSPGNIVSISPSSPSPGQTITIKGDVTLAKAVTGAKVVYWVFNAAKRDYGSVYQTTNLLADHSASLSMLFALPSSLPTGAYYISSAVYDTNWKLVQSYGDLVNFSVGTGSSGGGNGGGGNGGGGGKGSGGGLSVDTNQSTITSSADQATFSGTCVLLSTISVTGGITTTIPCTNGAWSFTTPTYTSDGTYGFILVGHSTSGGTSLPLTLVFTRQTSSGGGGITGIKFHPGMYVELDPGSGGGGLSGWISTIGSLKGARGVTGVMLIQSWSALEGSEGDYSAGFNMVDQLLAACKAAGLQFILGYEDRAFGGPQTYSSPTSYGQLPAYFNTLEGGSPGYLDAPSGTTFQGEGLQMIADVTNPLVTQREIALVTAYGKRYDSNPNFEMFRTPETANSAFTGGGQYDQYVTQLITWMAAARAAFPHTGISISTNFMSDPGQFNTLFNAAEKYAIGMGGPDTWPNFSTYPGTSNLVFNGYLGGTDYRGVLPWISEVQEPDENGNHGSPADIYNFAMSGSVATGGSERPNYFIWSYGASWQGSNAFTNGQILSFIESVNGAVNTATPSTYK